MLQIQNISKKYITGDLEQIALNNVSLNLRENEFVAILGPSGSGKTTLLNIIGGLDRYDSGDLIINGISTKKYKDRDWDSYRNHTIGFVFQSYNLIPHQSILSNVELALTISGVSKKVRKQRALKALDQVGLKDQAHKRPNQLSGGQMQRVAIARALVNDPDILLADEPTGALDTDTSIQVMDLLKEVAKDRLVVMVTHNPDLANQYANRIVNLKDGKIINDSNPYNVNIVGEVQHKRMGKSSMSLMTSTSLSFNNLRTKKARTFLTSFAGSIGIIGIALILSLSNGVNTYITDIQKDTMTSYPIEIDSETIDLSSIMKTGQEKTTDKKKNKTGKVYGDPTDLEMASSMTTSITENNLTKFKEYLDDEDSEIHQYLGENGVVYSYDVDFDVFSYDEDNTLVTSDEVNIEEDKNDNSYTSQMSTMRSMSAMSQSSIFSQILPGSDGQNINNAIKENYKVVSGEWPENYNEVVLTLDSNNSVSALALYELGLLPAKEYNDLLSKINAGEELDLDDIEMDYDKILNQTLYLVPACDQYKLKDDGTYEYIGDDSDELKKVVNDALQLKIVGIVKQKDADSNVKISGSVGYTYDLTSYIMDATNESAIVTKQKENKNVNVLNGLTFSPDNDEAKAEDAKKYLSELNTSDKAKFFVKMMNDIYGQEQASQMSGSMSESELASTLDSYLLNDPDQSTLVSIYDAYISSGTYDDNMATFGVVSEDAPSSISLYADTFEDKDGISECIDNYNDSVDEEYKIEYTDYVALLMSSVTTIINVITYVLVAFVAVSLIVSSIMIGIITYISVLERTKEIGILRAIGASKHNITQVFNAETFIIGLFSGFMGVGISLLLLIPINAIIHSVTGNMDVNAVLPIPAAIILIVLSVILTLIGGFIPAKKAAKKDPVLALRTE